MNILYVIDKYLEIKAGNKPEIPITVFFGAKAAPAYTDKTSWAKKMLVNIAKAGFFSSDRTIEQYNKDIWKL